MYQAWPPPFEPPRRGAVRPSPMFLAFVVVAALGAVLAWTNDNNPSRGARFGVFVFVLGAWVVSLCFHEFAHAFGAWRAGDRDVVVRGYLTLNPFKYVNAVYSIVLPILFLAIGGIPLPGGAVWINTQYFRHRWQKSLVSFVGPGVNLVLAAVLLIIVRVLTPASMTTFSATHQLFWFGVTYLAYLQLVAAVLNLLPIPGLDGWGVIEPFLDPATRDGGRRIAPFGGIIMFVLLWGVPAVNQVFRDVVNWLFELSGISSDAIFYGQQAFRFWTTF